ncbi:MAG: hypothetical protein M0C28_16015 [Candidatus Moduliflexus flocculans]|nr:hypothetical protein [Candidatus Moduliflexus flocculans]
MVRRGAALLAAERSLSRRGAGRAAVLAGQAAIRDVDLALGTALLVSAGRFRPDRRARAAELRLLAAPADGGTRREGLHVGMTRTRFRDVVERHRGGRRRRGRRRPAGDARRGPHAGGPGVGPLSRGAPPPRGAAARPAACRRGPTTSAPSPPATAPPRGPGLFGAAHGDELPGRRAVRDWPLSERLAPALATLLDWDPGDLPIAPVLLDLPGRRSARGARGAPRDAGRRRPERAGASESRAVYSAAVTSVTEMADDPGASGRLLFVLALLAGLLLRLVQLGSPDLFGPDEGAWAVGARNIVEGGSRSSSRSPRRRSATRAGCRSSSRRSSR